MIPARTSALLFCFQNVSYAEVLTHLNKRLCCFVFSGCHVRCTCTHDVNFRTAVFPGRAV